MKALALIERPDHVCYRYRIEAFAWSLAEQGWTLEAAPLEKHPTARAGQFARAGRVDAVILQRRLLPLWQLQILRTSSPCLIFDVDDAVYQRDSFSKKPPESRQRLARFWATVYMADAVIVGNDFLRDRVAGYIGEDRVHVVPTCVEPRRYETARHERVGGGTRLVWIGQQSTMPSLRQAGLPLSDAAADVPGLKLHVICDASPDLPGIEVVPRRWSEATEASDLADCDVGICWLPDDAWSRGKCGLKVLQYMAAGLPVVANSVGMNRRLVVHGKTGFLADTRRQWATAIRRLAADPQLRQRMGEAGRRLVEQHYSVDHWAPEFAGLVGRIATGSTDGDGPRVNSGNFSPLAAFSP